NASDLNYPVLCLSRYGLSVVSNPDRFATAFVADLRSGYFESLIVIDRNGMSYRVAEALKAGWAGPFFGFSLKYSRRAKVALKFEPMAKRFPLHEVTQIVRRDFEKSPEWSSRVDMDELRRR